MVLGGTNTSLVVPTSPSRDLMEAALSEGPRCLQMKEETWGNFNI